MWNKPTAERLGIFISLVIALVFSITIFWLYTYNLTLLRRITMEYAKLSSVEIVSNLNKQFGSVRQLCDKFAEEIPHHHIGGIDIEKMMTQETLQNENIMSLWIYVDIVEPKPFPTTYFVEQKNGVITYSQQYGHKIFDQSEHDRLFSLITSSKEGWTEPFFQGADSQKVVLYYEPILAESPDGVSGATVGYVVCKLSLKFMDESVYKVRFGRNGFAFVMTQEGDIISSPGKKILFKNVLKQPYKVFRNKKKIERFFNSPETGLLIAYPNFFGSGKNYVYNFRMDSPDWIVALTMPRSEVFREMSQMIFMIISVLLVLLIIALVSIFVISRRILLPISQAASEISDFSTGKSRYKNEAEALVSSLERLQEMRHGFDKKEAESNKRSERMLKELIAAQEVQQSLIPSIGEWTSEEAGVSVYSVFLPANIIGGDLFDYFMLDDENLFITIGDVSGSGVSGALFMSVAHTYLKSFLKSKTPARIVKEVNRELCYNNINQFFMTLFLGILNVKTRKLTYCNAGHVPTVIVHADKADVLKEIHGLPLGLYPDESYKESSIELRKGDSLILYTDGLLEQVDESGAIFGIERLKKTIEKFKDSSPEQMAKGLFNTVENYSVGNSERDDLCLMVMKYDGRKDDDAAVL